jgi:predicted AAA+ superfamily ATPase
LGNKTNAYRWLEGELVQIDHIEQVHRGDLVAIDRQVNLAVKNIEAFVKGIPALNMLLWGEKGLGKSTMIKMLLTEYAEQGLTAVEFRHTDITDLYGLYAEIRKMSDRFVMICMDDISFDAGDSMYRLFKSILEGGLEEKPKNCIFVATSNKRHMITEKAETFGDVYDRDEVNEKASLFARFGLAIGFYPLNPKDYKQIVKSYLEQFNIGLYDTWETEAEAYAMDRGGRSGRIAKQFAIYKNIYR